MFLVRSSTAQGKNFELILTVRMKIRHPTRRGTIWPWVSGICNHFGVMTAWSRKTCFFRIFCVFLEKRSLTVKLSKFCSERFHRLDDVIFRCRKIRLTGNRQNRALFAWQKKFRLPLKLSLLSGSRPKSTRASPNILLTISKFHSNRFTFGGVIAERVNTVLLAHRVFP